MASTPATKILSAAKIPHEVHSYDHDPRVQSYGDEAATAMGVSADQVFKTLVIELADGKLAVAVLPVAAKLSLKSAAAALGSPKAVMADPAKAQRTTGYVLGGISPLGQKRLLPTVIDASALSFPMVFCSAGKRGLEISLKPSDLVQLTKAVTAGITA
ncbi:MAG: Cys-tRNA(Pro) deacylase [Nocardiaceae bacterium]|nr:Cys-tRNA(Pro) deacylase [Nocardiaceae bacterium]